MSHLNRSSLLFALIGCLGGCQPLDSGAALGEPFKAETEGTSAALGKPTLELEDGSIADDACDAVRTQAYQILDRTCGNCHGGGAPGATPGPDATASNGGAGQSADDDAIDAEFEVKS